MSSKDRKDFVEISLIIMKDNSFVIQSVTFFFQIDHAIEVGTRLAINSKDALDQIVQSSDHEYRRKPKKKVGMKLSKALRMVRPKSILYYNFTNPGNTDARVL